MAFYTSYVYRTVELNDTLNYAVPAAGLNIDDRQSADEGFLYRGAKPPVSTGITLKEGTIAFNLFIVASNGADFEAKLLTLLKVFDTTDPTYYQLRRKLPHEVYYRYLEVAPRQITINRQERKVTVTLKCKEMAWQEDGWESVTQTLFAGLSRTEVIEADYLGATPVEPVIEVKALTVGSDGPVPLYYNDAVIYAKGPEHVIGTPIEVVAGWDTTSLVGGGAMRADGLDITVTLADGTPLPRYIGGTTGSRCVWVKPHVWPRSGPVLKLDASVTPLGIGAGATEIPVLVESGTVADIPQSGKAMVNDEIFSYSGVRANASFSGRGGTLTGCVRGLDGTTAATLVGSDWNVIRFPVALKVRYGYVSPYDASYFFSNDLSDWPVLDYASSTNEVWKQLTANTSPGATGHFSGRPLSWRGMPYQSGRGSELVYASASARLESGTAKMQLAAGHYPWSGVSSRERIAMQLLPLSSRRVTRAKVKFTVTAGIGGQFKTIKAVFAVTRSNFYDLNPNDPTTWPWRENAQDLFSLSVGTGAVATDSDWQNIDQDYVGATHLFLYVPEAPTNGTSPTTMPPVNVVLDEVHLELDQNFKEYPVAVFDGTQKGYGITGEFPVVLSVTNLDDAYEPTTFRIFPYLFTDDVAVFDCGSYTTEVARLQECSYDDVKWCRLLPGVNHLQFVGTPGIGQVEVTIRWKNKK